MMRLPTDLRICVIGAGRLGRTIIRTFEHSITTVITRNLSSIPADFAGAGERFVVSTDLETVDPEIFDLIWLAVPDDQIEPLAERLSRQWSLSDQIVVHSAGGRGRDIVSVHLPSSITTAILHPNAIIDGTRGFDAGLVWGVTAEDAIRPLLEEMITSIGGIPITVEEASRPLYHAAATLTANYVMTLADAALALYQEIGIDRAVAVTMIRHYLSNVIATFDGSPLAEHLTGPAARGDLATLRAHRRQLVQRSPQLVELFDALVDATLKEVRPELVERWEREGEDLVGE